MLSPATRTLVKTMIKVLDSTAKSFNDVTDMSNFCQFIIQIVDGSQYLTGAGDFGIGVANDVSRTVVGICDRALHLIFELSRVFQVSNQAGTSSHGHVVNRGRG